MLTALEAHASSLRSHMASIRKLIADCSGVAVLLPNAGADYLSLYWQLERTKAMLARCEKRIGEERAKAREGAA